LRDATKSNTGRSSKSTPTATADFIKANRKNLDTMRIANSKANHEKEATTKSKDGMLVPVPFFRRLRPLRSRMQQILCIQNKIRMLGMQPVVTRVRPVSRVHIQTMLAVWQTKMLMHQRRKALVQMRLRKKLAYWDTPRKVLVAIQKIYYKPLLME